MFWTVTLSILQGCSQAVKLFFLTLLFALPLGLVVAFGSMSKWAPFRALAYRQQEARGFARWLSQLRYAADPPAYHHFLRSRHLVRRKSVERFPGRTHDRLLHRLYHQLRLLFLRDLPGRH